MEVRHMVKKLMRKVKNQWVIVGVSLLAVAGAGVSMTVSAETSDVDDGKTETNSIAEQYRAVEWIAKTVDEIKTEIRVQGDDIQKGYLIKWGDTLWGISQATGIPISEIVAANNLADPDLIYAGDWLYVMPTTPSANTKQTSGVDDTGDESPKKVTQSYQTPAVKTPVATSQQTQQLPQNNTPTKVSQQNNTQTENTNTQTNPTPAAPIIPTPEIPTTPTPETPIIPILTTRTIEETIKTPFDVIYVEDETLNLGEERIVQEGTVGITVNTYTEVLRNQLQESKTLTNTVVISAPQNQIVHIGVKEVKQESRAVSIPFGTSYQYDDTLEAGKTAILQEGSMGEAVETYNVTYLKGVKIAEEFVGTTVTKIPVNQIVNTGTQLVETKAEVVTENFVPYILVEQEDSSLLKGEKKLIQTGSNGYDKVTYEVTYRNGAESNRVEVNREMIAPINEIVAVGTFLPVSSISLGKATAMLEIGETTFLSLTISPSGATNQLASWVSSDDSVATVDAFGNVTGVGKGTATITATVGDKTATCEVTVAKKVKIPLISISLDIGTLNLAEGATGSLAVILNPTDTTDDKKVIWTSSDKKVATVDDYGNVTAVSAGTATIMARIGGNTAISQVFVSE